MGMVIYYTGEFLGGTAILFTALWIMLKLQKLEFNYPALIGTAALGVAVNIGVHQLIGIYGAFGLVTVTLYLCVWKMTKADFLDVKFTVVIASALVFLINICLVTFLTPDLRPDLRRENYTRTDDAVPVAVTVTNRSKPAPVVAQAGMVATNGRTTAAVTPVPSNSPAPAPLPAVAATDNKFASDFSLRGLTQNSVAIVHTSKKTYTIAVGESVPMETAAGSVNVHCDSISASSVVLDLEGKKVPLSLH